MTGSTPERNYMTGAEIHLANDVAPQDVITSLYHYAIYGGDIDPTTYDAAVARCEPPMTGAELRKVVDLCERGIFTNHFPKTPIDHDRPGHQELAESLTQSHFAALMGATLVRIGQLNS